ncbi:MAG: caspase family protein [Candidatus Hatepunaea meridiana]|nr:caspase family protein [Candidatus Hatepunaea meridiana]
MKTNKNLFLISALIAIICFQVNTAGAANWYDLYARGTRLMKKENYDKAAECFANALKQNDSDNPRVRTSGMRFIKYYPHRELGICYYNLGRYSEAMEQLRVSIRQSSTSSAKSYLSLAEKQMVNVQNQIKQDKIKQDALAREAQEREKQERIKKNELARIESSDLGVAGQESHIEITPLKRLKEQPGLVVSMAFSPDSKYLASRSGSNIQLWNTETGSSAGKLTGHSDGVWDLCFSGDGQLASASFDETSRLWSIVNKQSTRTITGHSAKVRAVALSPDGKRLASGDGDGIIKLWDMQNGQELKSFNHYNRWINTLEFSPNGSILASGDGNGTIKLWNIYNGEEIKTLKGHYERVDVAFSPDGKYLASGSKDTKIKIWDVENGNVIRTLEGHTSSVNSICFSPDGFWLASGSGKWDGGGENNSVRIWLVGSGQEVRKIKAYNTVYSVAFSPDGSMLAAGSGDYSTAKGEVELWRVKMHKPEFGLPPNLFAELSFEDDNGNGILDAMESALLEVTLYNKGKGTAHLLQICIEDDQYDPELKIGGNVVWELPSKNQTKVTIPIRTGMDLKSAKHRFKISVLEYFGYDMDPAYLSLNTQEYSPPKLVYSGMDIDDWSEGTGGNDEDGQLQAGELVKMKIVVQNIGQEPALNTKYSVRSDDNNIRLKEGYGTLGTIKPGEVKEFWITISPNKRVTTEDDLPVYLTMTESIGKGKLLNFQLPIKLNQKPPQMNVVEVKPDLSRLQQQIAKFEYTSSKFKTRIKKKEDVWAVKRSRSSRPNSTAVVIGVENYKKLAPAPFAARDADLMEKYFRELLGVDNVVLYKDNDVSGMVFDDIFNPDNGELQTSIIQGETELFVYYSGHGIPNKTGSEVYLVPSDVKIHRLEEQGYSLNKFYKNLSELGAKNTMVILDACFSGGSRSTGSIKEENLVAHKAVGLKIKEPWRTYKNFTVINSSTGSETSLGFDQSETGLFTYYLALGLKGKADDNNDQKVTVGELKRYVIANVKETSKKMLGLQTPQFYGDESRVLVEY